MKNTLKIATLFALVAMAAFGQLTTTSTTLSAAVSAGTTSEWCIASATGVSVPSIGQNGTILFTDKEAAQVTAAGSSSTCFRVKRGQLGTSAQAAHATGTAVWVGNAATSTGDPSRPFSGGPFITTAPSGSCDATAQYTLPLIVTGGAMSGLAAGAQVSCVNSRWGTQSDRMYYVSPSNCTFAPTTLTTTNTYIQVGASTVFVLNGTSNAAAGTNTLTCDIMLPTRLAILRGTQITDITLMIGSQTTAPTSLGTATLGYIQFPAAATSETASTVTPVTIGGTVTTTSPTLITTVTTAGSFLTIKHTFSTAVNLSTDLQILRYTMPFLQSAAAAMTLNTPGLLVHYKDYDPI